MANKGNVTVGKPLVAGAVYRAPVGTTLPTAADATLDQAFAPVGYISEEGLRWSYSGDGDVIRAWGRDVVARPAGVVDDVATFQMLETVDEEAVKAFWGDDARQIITGGYALQVGVPSPVQYSWVIDMLLPTKPDPAVIWPSPRVRRIVIPMASVREREEISYQDSELVAYGLSLKAGKNNTGKYHYEYFMTAIAEIVRYEGGFDLSLGYIFPAPTPVVVMGGCFNSGSYQIYTLQDNSWVPATGDFGFTKGIPEAPVQIDLQQAITDGDVSYGDKLKIVFIIRDYDFVTLETPAFEVIE